MMNFHHVQVSIGDTQIAIDKTLLTCVVSHLIDSEGLCEWDHQWSL